MEAAGLPLWKSSVVIACDDPYFAMATLSRKFAPMLSTVAHVEAPEAYVHPMAWVDLTAKMGRNVRIGAHCSVEAGVEIGDGSVLYPGVSLGPSVKVGKGSVIFANVSVYENVRIGDRVRIHSGSVIGADGFGYAPERLGKTIVDHRKIYHFGSVVIGDDVEIGACVTIDRGTVADTVVGPKAKIDNKVHLGHNSQVGEGAVLCGGSCLAGSASVGRFIYMGGMSGVNNKTHVGDGAMIGAMTMVTKDVPPGGNALGNPQRLFREHLQVHAILNRLLADKKKKG
jgi:UDP-3-O-[3-hydroxymyristoyl] glucosamine N-acyltransferase